MWFIGVEVQREMSAPPPAIYMRVTTSTINFAPIQGYKTKVGLLGGIDPMQKMAAGLKFFCLN